MDNFDISNIEFEEEVRIVFMGTPDFSVPILEALSKNYNVKGVVTQPDKPVGRNKELLPTPVKKYANDNLILVIQPENIRESWQEVVSFHPNLISTCAYGQIVPQGLLDIPPLGCINVHASLLPKYRGGAPIHRSIINGDKVTGVTIMEMVTESAPYDEYKIVRKQN